MPLSREDLLKLHTNLVRARKLDELLIDAFHKGKSSPIHSGIGQEAVGVGACTFLREDDYLVPSHRGHGCPQLLPKGVLARTIIADHYGRVAGSAKGFGIFGADMDRGVAGIGATIGSCFPIATGLGIAAQTGGKGQAVVCIFGDGAAGRGTLHESMNLAAVWKLPIVWICENNQYAMWLPTKDAYPKEDIADMAASYGIPGVVVDGQDVVAVYEGVMSAVERARAGKGPSLIECKTLRFRPHFEGMPYLAGATVVSEAELEQKKKRDPIKLFQEKLLAQGILTQADVERIDREVTQELAEEERIASESPYPEPDILYKALYAD